MHCSGDHGELVLSPLQIRVGLTPGMLESIKHPSARVKEFSYLNLCPEASSLVVEILHVVVSPQASCRVPALQCGGRCVASRQ